ncbi:hypothetical protein GR11A_00178 [Vibrio phage vB_VcorM_GR11A]|nr:hypothetical protein GR11A_00178 [Vibrio phage vB_VcorM_GR11A]
MLKLFEGLLIGIVIGGLGHMTMMKTGHDVFGVNAHAEPTIIVRDFAVQTCGHRVTQLGMYDEQGNYWSGISNSEQDCEESYYPRAEFEEFHKRVMSVPWDIRNKYGINRAAKGLEK